MRALIAPLAVVALGGAIGCGEEVTVADGEIVQALELERDDERPVYAIGGDAFCEVEEDLLNNESEVEDATSAAEISGLVITNDEQSVGVQAIPPFDPNCERDAKRALNGIEVE